MQIIRQRGLGFDMYMFVSIEKDGVPCHVMKCVQGSYMKREELQEIIMELQRELSLITDEDIIYLNKIEYLQGSPRMFLDTYGHNDPLWIEYVASHPEVHEPPPKKTRKPVPGYVYVIRGGDHCKIGCTKNVTQRLRPMSATAPFPLETLALIASGDIEMLEMELHTTFAAKRIRGEWFNLDDADLEAIRSTYDLSDPNLLKVK